VLLLIDNYDSFTYNLYQHLSELGEQVQVTRNDRLGLDEIEEMRPDRIVISPGPSTPEKAGVSSDVIRRFGRQIPILGVCLGHQCLGYACGGRIGRAGVIMHGKSSLIFHKGVGVFAGLPNPFSAIRYHSLMVEQDGLPEVLEVTAWTEDGTIMGLRHRDFPAQGIQFHPESFLPEHGRDILRNFLGGSR
jgi:anthranilate synthase/aminodeoxychorismate synthase-like glutamine amidotransferase